MKTKASQTKRAVRASLNLRRILVPIDFSGKSRDALDYAVPLARQHGGKITLVHVVQTPVSAMLEAIPGNVSYLAGDDDRLVKSARQQLEKLAKDRVPATLRGGVAVRQGNPYDEITSAARGLKVDLIVIATHGHTGLKRALIGSVAERVVRHAPCAVLTVRRD